MSKRLKKVTSVITSIATIGWLSGASLLMPIVTTHAAVAGVNEGDTIRVAGTFDVYIAKYVGTKAFKRLILNPEVFNSYKHLSWAAVKTVSQATMDQFTTSSLVRALGDTKVYMLTPNGDVGAKQWLNMTADQFTALGYDWDSIYVINDVDRDNYTTGADIGSTGTPVPTPGAAGTVTVSLAADTPAAGVAIESSARVPMTKVNFTAGPADVTITGVTMQRTGLSDDAVISTVTLIDNQTNLIVGLSQTLNANHQATVTDTITILANTTKSYSLAANMPTDLNSYAGQIVALSLVGLTTSATVAGTLPITGNYQTINATLTMGSATMYNGSLDNATSTKAVGTTNYNFSSLKITAGSTEDITLYSIKFNQSGSAAASDLANVVVSDGTTNYATIVSSDGKYYTVSFGTSGIVIAKGLSAEFTIKGDVVSGSSRTVKFDVYKNTDISVKGNLYGYYMTVGSSGSRFSSTSYPFFYGNTVTVGTGSLRVDKNSTAAPSSNVTAGAQGVILGAYDFVVQGEAVNVGAMELAFTQTGTGSTSDITNITLSKADGTVVSGPVNGSQVTAGTGKASFSGTVTFPVGTTVILVKGNLNNSFKASDTIITSFNTPDAKITNATGATTGNSITASPTSQVLSNTMTVKAGSLLVKVSGSPVAQSVVKGAVGFNFANFIFDGTASGENIRVTSMAVQHGSYSASKQSEITALTMYDGSTALTTGTNVLTGTNASASSTETYVLDNALIIPAGTIKTVALKGNISGNATATGHEFGLASNATISATGVSTGQTISAIVTASNGQKMSVVSNGQWSVALDAANPAAALVAADTTTEFTRLKLTATTEAINLTNMELELTSASSTGVDLTSVDVYDGATKVGTGVFIGASGTTQDFTFSPAVVIPKNDSKVLMIKATVAKIGSGEAGTSGHIISINYKGSATADYGYGVDSGTKVAGYLADTASNGMIVYKSVPTIAKVAASSNTLAAGTRTLYKFTVAADAKGDIDLYKVTFQIATSGTATYVSDLVLYDITGGTSVVVQNDRTGNVPKNNTDIEMVLELNNVATTPRTIAAGTVRTFELDGTVALTSTGNSVTTQLQGDAAQPGMVAGTYMEPAGTSSGEVDNDTYDNFIWSDRNATSHTVSTADWTNGYLVSGLPGTNLTSEVLSN